MPPSELFTIQEKQPELEADTLGLVSYCVSFGKTLTLWALVPSIIKTRKTPATPQHFLWD